MTDHSAIIQEMRERVQILEDHKHVLTSEYDDLLLLALPVAADLLEIHDATGISLDNWPSARTFVERLSGVAITENGA